MAADQLNSQGAFSRQPHLRGPLICEPRPLPQNLHPLLLSLLRGLEFGFHAPYISSKKEKGCHHIEEAEITEQNSEKIAQEQDERHDQSERALWELGIPIDKSHGPFIGRED